MNYFYKVLQFIYDNTIGWLLCFRPKVSVRWVTLPLSVLLGILEVLASIALVVTGIATIFAILDLALIDAFVCFVVTLLLAMLRNLLSTIFDIAFKVDFDLYWENRQKKELVKRGLNK